MSAFPVKDFSRAPLSAVGHLRHEGISTIYIYMCMCMCMYMYMYVYMYVYMYAVKNP
jgi:hypothetical protein